MKQTKRKVFDAVDLLTAEVPECAGVQTIAIDSIMPFHNHPFKLYEGARLDDMVESIKEHGVLTPVIVRKTDVGYEMLAGHNRSNAARLAGLTQIPAVVKENISDEEALIYVVETNMMQRSFTDMAVSERIAVLSTRYEEICGVKKREEIVEELHRLNGDGGHDVHQDHQLQKKSRDVIGQEYGMTGRNIARYIRCNQLMQGFKDKLDNGSLSLVVAVELSYLDHSEQEQVLKVMQDNKYTMNFAKSLRAAAGEITEELILSLLHKKKGIEKAVSIKISDQLYRKYFADIDSKNISGILEEALKMYFDGKGE